MKVEGDRLGCAATDLVNFTDCEHLTVLDRLRALDELDAPTVKDPMAELASHKGDEHERKYIEQLRASGHEVVEIDNDADLESQVELTIEAIRSGREYIYQAAFMDGRWRGYADVLQRVQVPSDLGDFSYEVIDAKLARTARPHFIIQLCFYSEALAKIQGALPKRVHLWVGTNEMLSYPLSDFFSYYHRVKGRFTEFLDRLEDNSGNVETWPWPVPHCTVCRWADRCASQRQEEDHLSVVANIRRGQIEKLNVAGVMTLTELAALERLPQVGIARSTFEKLHRQASLQSSQRESGKHTYELLEPEPGKGLALMPPRSANDIYLDLEGDPFYQNNLEYLWGYSEEVDGKLQYTVLWAHDQDAEKQALEAFIDHVRERLADDPDMHVYHYGDYELSAMKRLACLNATRQDELDDLLRHQIFVDLYRVVRTALQASTSSYSLKDIEGFYKTRTEKIKQADESIVAYERYLANGDQSELDAIEAYNREDCESTFELHEWLEGIRPRARKKLGALAEWRGPPKDEPVTENRAEEDRLIADLKRQLLDGVPEDLEGASADQKARWLLAQLLDYHRREDKPAWWRYYDRQQMTTEELIEDTDSLGGLVPESPEPVGTIRQSYLYALKYPPQDHALRTGQPAYIYGEDRKTIAVGDVEQDHIFVRRGTGRASEPLPRALFPVETVGTRGLAEALQRVATALVQDEDSQYLAGRDILLGKPRFIDLPGGATIQPSEITPEAVSDVLKHLDSSYLFIQGPPGSGKTWLGARLIVELVKGGARVGITAPSHKAIRGLVSKVVATATDRNIDLTVWQKIDNDQAGDTPWSDKWKRADTAQEVRDQLAAKSNTVPAGTAWLFANKEIGENGSEPLDYLFVDEAGQYSLANALAAATATKNLVLLGDPLQLAHVSQATHPIGTEKSVLEHLLGDDETIAPDKGIFLDMTWRMHPDVCAPISELIYEGRLHSRPGCERQTVTAPGAISGTGLRYVPVSHQGNGRFSPEEVDKVAEIYAQLLKGNWTDQDGLTHEITVDDVLVVAPYNRQVNELTSALPDNARVGTVDKFQGQQAAVVIFSMATSSGAEIPRNIEFLFSRNRLNVAISRAQSLAILVCSPKLLDTRSHTVEQMRLINALCFLTAESR